MRCKSPQDPSYAEVLTLFMIVAAAEHSGATLLYTDDLSHRQHLRQSASHQSFSRSDQAINYSSNTLHLVIHELNTSLLSCTGEAHKDKTYLLSSTSISLA